MLRLVFLKFRFYHVLGPRISVVGFRKTLLRILEAHLLFLHPNLIVVFHDITSQLFDLREIGGDGAQERSLLIRTRLIVRQSFGIRIVFFLVWIVLRKLVNLKIYGIKILLLDVPQLAVLDLVEVQFCALRILTFGGLQLLFFVLGLIFICRVGLLRYYHFLRVGWQVARAILQRLRQVTKVHTF